MTEKRAKSMDIKSLQKALSDAQCERVRLRRLKDYYLTRNDILYRRKRGSGPNLRLPHGFAYYIVNLMASFMLRGGLFFENAEGLPLSRMMPENIDRQLALDQALYGRAVSLFYEDEGGLKLARLSPEYAFVLKDGLCRPSPLCGMLAEGKQLHVYSDSEYCKYEKTEGGLRLIKRMRHGLGYIPMIEYKNNEDGFSDFERALPLIDAYDLLASDRMNDRVQFADAMLVLTGVMGLHEEGGDAHDALRTQRTISLPDSDSRAEWLVKNPTEKDIEVLRRALSDDIHKFCGLPDFSRAMENERQKNYNIRLQMLALEGICSQKRAFFMEGVQKRIDIIEKYYGKKGIRAGMKESSFDKMLEGE